MKDFYLFIISNFKKLSFGWILTFLSSFGQTFLISLYVPEIIKAFSISEGTFGAIYAGCTVTASVIMLSLGHNVDHKPAKTVTAFSITGLAIASILLGFSYHFVVLILAIIMLRLFGQGLLTHISMTLISKGSSPFDAQVRKSSCLGSYRRYPAAVNWAHQREACRWSPAKTAGRKGSHRSQLARYQSECPLWQ